MAVPNRPPVAGKADDGKNPTPETKPVRPTISIPDDLNLDTHSFKGHTLDNEDDKEAKILAEKLDKLTSRLGPRVEINPLYSALTAEHLLVHGWERYEYLMPKVIKTKEWLTDVLQQQNRNVEVAEARTKRGAKYDEMYSLITSLLERYYMQEKVVSGFDNKILTALVANEILGLGPLEPLWRDQRISEIMVNGPYKIRIEMGGRLMDVPGAQFRDAEHALEVAQQILAPINRSIDVSHPLQDGSLVDGSRVNIVHPSIAEKGPYITIRRFPDTVFTLRELVKFGSMNEDMATDLGNWIGLGLSAIIVGGTGSGKANALNTLLPTPYTMTTMGEVKVGDYVLDENGKPTKVLAYYPQPLNPCFDVIFSDGTVVTSDENHNWLTSTRSARRAVSRRENTGKIKDAKRTRVATDEEIAKVMAFYNSVTTEIVSPVEIISVVPRLRNIIYNLAKTLTPVKKEIGGKVFYARKELLELVIAKAHSIINDQRHKSAVESVVTTREIFETLKTSTGHTNHAVRMLSQAVPYEEKDLIVQPYTFGAWLGDGFSREGVVCGADEEVFTNITNEGYLVERRRVQEKSEIRKTDFHILKFEGLRDQLKALGVLKTDEGSGVETKFIPDEYLYSSVEQRKALIAGLLDTDGTVSKSTGNVQFINSNKSIIDGFRQIIHSLGYQSTLRQKIPTYTYKGEKKQGKMSYTVSFFAKEDMFRLERKNEIHRGFRELKSQGHRMEWRYIVDVVPVESVPTACITVDSPNSLYLCSDAFIVTHNTSSLNALSGCIPPGERVLVIEDTSELRLHPERDILYLQARPAQNDDNREVSIRALVKNALRMRPDRIVVGEVRDFSAYDMLQAMNTGHDGSMTTIHANDAHSGVERLVNLLSEGGESAVESNRVLSLISSGVDLFVTIQRYEDGSRRCSGIYEIPNMVSVADGQVNLEPIPLWEFVQNTAASDEDAIDGIAKVTGVWERRADLSDSMKKKHRTNHRPWMSLEEIYAMSDQAEK